MVVNKAILYTCTHVCMSIAIVEKGTFMCSMKNWKYDIGTFVNRTFKINMNF